jgi:predicted RNA-binding Zn-ribbon protein involved in translation (DUF1610 family)
MSGDKTIMTMPTLSIFKRDCNGCGRTVTLRGDDGSTHRCPTCGTALRIEWAALHAEYARLLAAPAVACASTGPGIR